MLVLLWPAKPLIELNKAPIQISLTMGAPGGDNLPSPVLGRIERSLPKKPTQALPSTKAIELAKPQTEPKPVAKPIPKPTTKPVVKKATKPKIAPKPKPPPSTPKPAATRKPSISPEDSLKKALADATKEAGPRKTPKPKKPRSPIAGALASLEKNVKAAEIIGGGAGKGDGPGGGGLYDVYMGMIIMAVRPNWSMPTYSRENLVVYVRVNVDPNGLVQNASIERSSGRADFDASAVNAVIRTKQLPKPPTPDHQEIVIAFNALEMTR